uniref:Bifunctional inhibitor/plant lipid transfer protein/seed storage helical domain-containing protein n=1 Tax=Aegilops tauschii subsp. strangulata TaxID=200361 RepID=A0A453PT93_AEGTS
MDPKLLALAVSAAVLLALALPAPASGQAAAATPSCTASLVSSFTPCLSYITNGNSSSPTAGCCRSLSALVNASTGCACLLLTGSVPLGGVPVNRTLAVTLPRACNSMAVPLQCKGTSILPASKDHQCYIVLCEVRFPLTIGVGDELQMRRRSSRLRLQLRAPSRPRPLPPCPRCVRNSTCHTNFL